MFTQPQSFFFEKNMDLQVFMSVGGAGLVAPSSQVFLAFLENGREMHEIPPAFPHG